MAHRPPQPLRRDDAYREGESDARAPTLPPAEAVADARALVRLLGGDVLASRMDYHGSYPGRFAPTVSEIAEHLAGSNTLAFACADDDGRSRILGFDFDRSAVPRINLAAECLLARGFDSQAMIATNGSDAERGKLLLFLGAAQSVKSLQRLGKDVIAQARCNEHWGTGRNYSIYPLAREGGLLRVGGRHLTRNGPLEHFYDPATGEAASLSRVVPTSKRLELEPQPIAIAPQQAFVSRWLEDGLTYGRNGTAGIRKCLLRLAFEAYRLRGEFGESLLREWLETIRAVSPDLQEPSPRNKDRRDPLAWERMAGPVWTHVVEQRGKRHITYTAARHITSSSPVGLRNVPGSADIRNVPSPPHIRNVPLDADIRNVPSADNVPDAVASVLSEFVDKRGLNPAAFQLSYREIAAALGVGASTARRRVKRSEACGQLLILDPGTQGAQMGDKAIYALPDRLDGRTPDQLRQHHLVQQRLAKRARYTAFCLDHPRDAAPSEKAESHLASARMDRTL